MTKEIQSANAKAIMAWRVVVIFLFIALIAADICIYWFYFDREPFRSLNEFQMKLLGFYSPKLTVFLALLLPQLLLLCGVKIALERIFKIKLSASRETKK